MRVDIHPHEVERDRPRSRRTLPARPGQRDAHDLAANDLAASRRGEIERGAGQIKRADPLLQALGIVADGGEHDRPLDDELIIIGRGRIMLERQIGGIRKRGGEFDVRRIDDDRVVGFAIDEAGDRRAVSPVDHSRAIAEAMGRRVGDLVGPSLRRGHGRRGGESERGTGNGRERFVAGVGAEFVETRRRNVDRSSTKGGGQLDCLGIDQLDVIHSPRLKASNRLAAIGGVDDLLAINKPMILGELELVGTVLIDRGRGGIKRHLPGEIELSDALAAPHSGEGERNSDAGDCVVERRGQLD